MNFKLALMPILIAICLINGVQGPGNLLDGDSDDTIGKKIKRVLTFGILGQTLDNVEGYADPAEFFPGFKVPDRTDFTNKIKVAENENDLETNILPNSGDKLIIMAIIDGKHKPDVVITVDLLGDVQEGEIEIIVVYLEKCKDTAKLYGVNSDNPTYIFLKREKKDAICRYTRSDNYGRDFMLINHRVKEILGKTRVKVALSDDDFDEKFKSATENKSIEFTIIWFETDIAYDVDFGRDHNLQRVENKAKDHVLFIRANVNTCPKTFKHQNTINDKLETISFVMFKSNTFLAFFNGYQSLNYIPKVIERPNDQFEIVKVQKFYNKLGEYDLVETLHFIGDPDEPNIPYDIDIKYGNDEYKNKLNEWQKRLRLQDKFMRSRTLDLELEKKAEEERKNKKKSSNVVTRVVSSLIPNSSKKTRSDNKKLPRSMFARFAAAIAPNCL